MNARILFIINPIAGPRRNKSDVIHEIRRRPELQGSEIYETTCRGDAKRAARNAIEEGYETVVAVGGDGTVNEVASGIVGSRVALGLIPRGSGNGLARALRIPFHTRSCLDVIIANKHKQIDLGKAGHRYFCAVSGVGFDAAVSAGFDSSRIRGFFAYIYVVLKELAHYAAESCTLEVDGELISCTPFLVSVANTPQYGNGAIIAPKAKMDDGYFDLCLASDMKFRQLLTAASRLFLGSIDQHPMVHYFKVKKVTFRLEHPIQFHVDGEPEVCYSDLTIEVLPLALRVVIPAAVH